MTKICPNCGVDFVTTFRNTKFCSDGCRIEFKHDHQKTFIKTCPICGVTFSPSNSHQIYCSSSCRDKASYQYTPKPKQLKNCVICGKKFTPKTATHVCCSNPLCRKKHYLMSVIANAQKKLDALNSGGV